MTKQTTPASTAPLGDAFEQFHGAGKQDAQGRMVGFIVGYRDNGTDFYAWVQAARCKNNDLQDFGPRQRSKHFTSKAAAQTVMRRDLKVLEDFARALGEAHGLGGY